MELTVECYSGHTYAQEPRAFVWQDRRHIVQKVERTWRTPERTHFRVVTDAGERYELAYDEQADTWSLTHAPGVGSHF